MTNKTNPEIEELRDLKVLEALEQESTVKQAELASRVNLAVGTVNWLLKRLNQKPVTGTRQWTREDLYK